MTASTSIKLVLCCLLLSASIVRPSPGQTDTPVQPAEDPILGSRSTIDPQSPDHRWLERGAEIRESPEWSARVIAIVDIRVQVPIVSEEGDWLEVRYAGWKGWIHATGEREERENPQPEPEPFTTAPNPAVIEAAVEILSSEGLHTGSLGPFDLLTDIRDQRTLAFLDRVAARVPEAYRQRYGLDPDSEGSETVILFATDADYRLFTQSTTDSPGPATGHATRGIAVAAVGDKSRDEIAAILVHELTHLLNRRLFGRLELPWLDEGMANDLAYGKIRKRTGEIELGSLGGRTVVIDRPVYLVGGESRVDREVRLDGPKASLSLLRDSTDRLPLDVLTRLEPSEFMDPLFLRDRYDQSTFFVRYLLDSRDSTLASRFRSYLERLAGHREIPRVVPDLPAHLGRDIEQLEDGFVAWLESRGPR